MTRKILLLTSALILGACSISCSDRFTDTNGHLLDTAQSVYELRSLGKITADEALCYQDRVENAYRLTVDGSVFCDIDEDVAADKFEDAEDILDAVDDALNVNKIIEPIEEEGE